jgi:alpha-L-rhamnosidase
MPVTGAFDCSHRDVNQLMTNTLWTLEANVYGLPTACADRNERYGWFCDTDVAAQTSAFLLDMAALWTKSIRDIRDGQYKETFAPLSGSPQYVSYGAYSINNPVVPGSGVGDIGIESGGVLRPWRLYENYADTRMLYEHYLSVSNWLYYLGTNWVANKLAPWEGQFSTDVCNMDQFGFVHNNPPPQNWSTGHAAMTNRVQGLWAYIQSAELAADMSKILQAQALAAGDTAAASVYGTNDAAYLSTAASLRSYFTNAANQLVVYDSQTVTNIIKIGNGTQGDYVSALYFNMIPETQRSNCVYWMLNDANKGILNYNHNWTNSCTNHLSTGSFATARVMHELTRNGYNSKAYELLTDCSFPSWLYQITNGGPAYTGTIGDNYGATTCWEHWNGWISGLGGGYGNSGAGKWDSHNELWNASVGEWVWRTVAGINLDASNPGFKNVIVYPQPGGGITNCFAGFNSIHGTIRSSWTKTASTHTLSVTVPANTTASVFILGATNLANITESGLVATNAVGVLYPAVITNGAALFQVGSGIYCFDVAY